MGLPFTKRDRKRLCYQWGYGARPLSDWGSGDLPAPYAEGDIVELVSEPLDRRRLSGQEGPFFVVSAGFSIGEGDDWYFRVTDGTGGTSNRMHVFFDTPELGDHMAAFRLVDTSDPTGLDKRARILATRSDDTEGK